MIFTRKIGKITRNALFIGILENNFLIYPRFYPGNRNYTSAAGDFFSNHKDRKDFQLHLLFYNFYIVLKYLVAIA